MDLVIDCKIEKKGPYGVVTLVCPIVPRSTKGQVDAYA